MTIALPKHPRFIDLTGQQFGHLTVLKFLRLVPKEGAWWLCQCDCGKESEVRSNALRMGATSSCGCRQRFSKHGQHATPTYNCWENMIQRTTNPNAPNYKDYGGRGITVCERWMTFENFYADMGERPGNLEIDRFPNNNGNYEPGNCRWATRKQQCRNMRKNRLLTFRDKTQCVAAWADELGIHVATLWNRLRSGWSDERALTTPVAH